jgi:hypothetical protein
MLDDKYIDFFLGGNINEPVSIEIPVNVKNISDLIHFLESYSLDIDTDGKHSEKISVTQLVDRVGNVSIITPALNPKDLKSIYKILESLLEEYKKDSGEKFTIYYPHIIDLNSLATQKQSENTDTSFIEELLKEAEESDDIFVFDNLLQDIKKVHFKNHSLFCGAAMSDPYTVATGEYARYIRYGTTDISYAVGYSGVNGKKQFNGFNNILPNGQPIGFLHQYDMRDDTQLFFDNAGIETSQLSSYEGRFSETIVNRFNNPVIATYVLWKKPNDKKFYMIKIPTNDERWEKLKEYYATSFFEQDTAKRNKINNWIAEGDTHKAYVLSVDKTLSIQDLYNSVENKLTEKHNREKAEEKRVNQAIEKYKQLHEKYDEIAKLLLNIYVPGCRENADCVYYENYKKEVQKQIEQYEKSISELSQIYQKMQDIELILEKTSYNNFVKNALKFIQDAADKVRFEKIKTCQSCIKTSESLLEQHIASMCDNPQQIYAEQNMSIQYKEMILDNVLKKMKKTIDEKQAVILSKVIVNLYSVLSPEEKNHIDPKIVKIKNSAPKIVLKNIMKTAKEQNKSEIVKLFKTNLFETITKKLKKKHSSDVVILNQNTGMDL